MTPKDRVALAAYAEMLDDTVDLRNDSVGMDGGDPVRLLLAEHDRLADELRRLRISQLRRMAHTAWLRSAHPLNAHFYRKRKQYDRFAAACLAEIERLRGMG